MSRLVLGVVLVAVAAVAVACQSTQDKSRERQAQGGEPFTEEGLDVQQRNPDVRVVETRVLQDANGAAAVIVLRSRAANPLRGVPVEIDVAGQGRKSVFKNDQPGLDDSLTGPSVLLPGEEFAWVHDQVVAEGRVASVEATPGRAKGVVAGELPQLQVSAPRLEGDPTSGVEATGSVTNGSDVEQRELTLYCVARREGQIVAAGRGAIPRLKARQRLPYHIFFIGNPRGAKLTLEAPPTALQQGET